MKSYTTKPKNRLEATEMAKELKRFLQKYTGGTWKIRVHENLGWHYNVNCGTISISFIGNNSYMIMNSGDINYVGTGHASLTVLYAKNARQLVGHVQKSIHEFREHVLKELVAFNSNNKLRGYKAIVTHVTHG